MADAGLVQEIEALELEMRQLATSCDPFDAVISSDVLKWADRLAVLGRRSRQHEDETEDDSRSFGTHIREAVKAIRTSDRSRPASVSPKQELLAALKAYKGGACGCLITPPFTKCQLCIQAEAAIAKAEEAASVSPKDEKCRHLRDVAGLLQSLRESMALRDRVSYGAPEWLRTLDVAVKRLNELAASVSPKDEKP